MLAYMLFDFIHTLKSGLLAFVSEIDILTLVI